ncbi:hypothetical protein [Nocardioides acrostichi]|uniref:Uncharacterized protein n=1 Tax=Nocardioides acrostichi TaxID=2784339 RepID=A0A930Y6L2_9ACTN|nr:hypothetical protein [Nocardioides acrostichi]MBF4161061.1 hypothetical protein [Nocardioides acrostichi]
MAIQDSTQYKLAWVYVALFCVCAVGMVWRGQWLYALVSAVMATGFAVFRLRADARDDA